MIHLQHTVDGELCDIFVPQRRDELDGFWRFLALGDKVLGLDTETTGLDVYSPGFKVRTVQFGNRREAWVLRVELFRDAIIAALRQDRIFTIHKADFDLLVADRHLGVKIEELANRVIDTRILAHLLDPRQQHEGGAGLSLKPLSAIYVDDEAPDTQEGLSAHFSTLYNAWKKTASAEAIARHVRMNTKKPHMAYGFANVDIDHELYNRYAGLDVILGSRLVAELAPLVKELGLNDLSKFEHHLLALMCILMRRGMRVDVPYTEGLVERLQEEAEGHRKMAARYGVENVNSTAQVAACLEAMGVKLTERTDSGALKVDKNVLLPLAGLTTFWEPIEGVTPNPLADAVLRAKRAEKWATSYGQAFLDLRDSDNRLHAGITSLAARTARMSVSRPPLQQLPSTDWTIRRAIVADPGNRFISADYDQVELRILAALADVKGMKDAINAGVDLHGYTASLVYGPDFTPKHRKAAKGAGFGKVYGGGPDTLARQWGVPIDDMRHMVREYDRVYPEVKKYSARLQRRAEYGKREVVTVSGRHLPLDRDRLYAATNYTIQSTARDVMAQAIVDLFDAGLGDYLRLVIHDEVLAEAPEREAPEVAHEVGRIMSSVFYGVPITAEGEVTGKSWGAAYGADPEEGW